MSIDRGQPVGFKRNVSASLEVSLSNVQYPIHFLQHAREGMKAEFARITDAKRRAVVLTDRGVAEATGGLLDDVFGGTARLVLEAGEGTKSLTSYGKVLDFLARERVDRRGVVWVVGGGVMGDLGGFAAATYLRGVDCIQVPTTLLAMVDSSVGGKTGINLEAGKNLVGAFHHPRAVLIAAEFLATLPPREFAAGAAEVIKYGLLGDAALFGRLERAALSPTSTELLATIRRCCELKAAVVQADERETAEQGGRALLNLGHTFGHAIERVAGYGVYLHGEAVAIGLCAAARLSEKLGLIGAAEVKRVDAVVASHALPTRLRAPLALAELMGAMGLDKKVRGGAPRFVVMTRLGEAATRDDVPLPLAEACFREVGAG